MKVLVVDDNAEYLGVVRDLIKAEGCLTREASSYDEAVAKISGFAPDMIFLDSSIENWLSIISYVKEAYPSNPFSVIVLTGIGEHVPTDIPEIKGVIKKPFSSPVIVDALYKNAPPKKESAPSPRKKKKKKREGSSWSFLRFWRKKNRIPAPKADPEHSGAILGRCYAVFEEYPETIYKFVGLFSTNEYSVMIVTSEKVKAVKAKFDYGDIDVRTMSASPKDGMFDIYGLGTVVASVREFIESSPNPVVVFDNFDDIVLVNGINNTLKMFHLLISSTEGVLRTIAISANDAYLNDKDRSILLHDMKRFVPSD